MLFLSYWALAGLMGNLIAITLFPTYLVRCPPHWAIVTLIISVLIGPLALAAGLLDLLIILRKKF